MSGVNLHLDNTSNLFYPGSIVTGRAICNFNSSKDVRKVRIRLLGDESTHWTETQHHHNSNSNTHRPGNRRGHHSTNHTTTVSYNGYRDFLLRDLIVHGEGTMNSGEHVFPFEFLLPQDLPSTFQHMYGRIKYTVKVTVDLPMKIDYECERELLIISPMRFQSISVSLLEPVELSDEKTVCCFCCTSGPVQLDAKLDKRAFIIGETAVIKTKCSNMSNSRVDRISAEIKMKLTFKASRPVNGYKYDSELISTCYGSGVGAHGENTCDLRLEIPPSTVIPNFNYSELFGIETQLKVTAAISGCHTNIDLVTNVAIGHAPNPNESFTAQYQQAPQFYPSNAMPPMPTPTYGYGAQTDKPFDKPMGVPPYPIPGFAPGPSAPNEFGTPSAPGFVGNSNLGGNSSAYEIPPPTYDDVVKK